MNSKILLGLSVLVTVACADSEPHANALERELERLAQSGVIGVQAEIVDGDQHLWASAGVADTHRRSAIQEDARFRIASTTKTFVAALTLRLVDDAMLRLDDNLAQWLPELAAESAVDAEQITLRQLLSHRSGIANHVDDLFAMLGEAESEAAFMGVLQRDWQPEELARMALAHGPLFAPGSEFAYSDTNYVLVGMIIEAATQQSWESALSERVLEPLALMHTFAPGSDMQIPSPHMRGYAQLPFASGYRDVTRLSPSSLHAAASLISTPSDVNRFFSALLSGELLSSASLAEMKRVLPVSEEADAAGYGLGLSRTALACGGSYWGHDGDTLGFHTRNAVSEDGARSVCIAVSGDGQFEAEAHALIERALCARE
jgi:D-alanyl-D-alanine carboxypeptidase